MEDNKLAADEARREAQHESVKSQVESDVNAEIATRADHTTRDEARKMEQVAGEFRGKAIDDVVETEREVERARGMARVSQVVDYIFYLIYALLAIRLLLALLAARSSAGFVRLIYTVTDPLYSAVPRDRGQPDRGRGLHAGVANRDCDHRLRAAPRRHQRFAAVNRTP